MEAKQAASQDCQETPGAEAPASERIAHLVDSMFAQRSALVAIIDCCRSERTSAEIDEMLQPFQENRLNVFSPIMMRSLLEKAGALTYHSNDHDAEVIKDVKGDLVLPEPTVCTWTATEEGIAFIDALDPLADLTAALKSDEGFEPIYRHILQMCAEKDRAVTEIEQAVGADDLLADSTREPGFFVGKLEDLGALEWHGSWTTSDLGRSYLVPIEE